MIKKIVKDKTLTILIIVTVITFIIGLFFNAFIDDSIKKEIGSNINNLIKNINIAYNFKYLISNSFNVLLLGLIIWGLGISIVGIPIILFLYLFKVFMTSFEIVSLFSNLGINNYLFIIIYMLPRLLNISIYFILIYYSINYSIILIKLLFLKKEYNLKVITKRYIKILLICSLLLLISSLGEGLIISKILKLLI